MPTFSWFDWRGARLASVAGLGMMLSGCGATRTPAVTPIVTRSSSESETPSARVQVSVDPNPGLQVKTAAPPTNIGQRSSGADRTASATVRETAETHAVTGIPSNAGSREPALEVAAATESASTALRVGSAVATAPPQPFQFRDDAVGKIQAEQLPPPRKMALPNPPWVAEPSRPAPRFPDVADRQLWSFAASIPSGESRAMPLEHPPINRVLPTLDRPLPPPFSTSLVPEQPAFSYVARTRVSAARPDDTPPLVPTPNPFDLKPQVQDDPAAASAWKSLLSPLAFGDPASPPPEKLVIPDPFDYLRHVRLKQPLVDSHVPAVAYDRPATVTLPVDK